MNSVHHLIMHIDVNVNFEHMDAKDCTILIIRIIP